MMRYNLGLLTDLYELTMMQGYVLKGINIPSVFDVFFRHQPFNGGFSIFAGLEPMLRKLEELRFSEDDLEYLEGQGLFKQEFLDYLKDFRFRGDIYAMDEGTAIFPNEPILRVHASFAEAQLIESLLLNIVNFQTLIATKSARIYYASNKGIVLEFGLRRAQGVDGAISATRAAYIGGASATSNTLGGKLYDIPVKGTMAHSWIMAFDDELESFQKYAELYPDSTLLLIDTYDTLESGIKNAITVGKKLKEQGKPFGVRLDSGDLNYLSCKVREELDKAGLDDAKIAASNELNEEIIQQLINGGAPIDMWGVGTHMVTGGKDSSLTGVYKLAAVIKNGVCIPRLKISNNPEKTTNPGIKEVYRFHTPEGQPIADLLAISNETIPFGNQQTFYHPNVDFGKFTLKEFGNVEKLLTLKMKDGKIVDTLPSLPEIRKKTKSQLDMLDASYKRLLNPHVYKVSLSKKLRSLKTKIIEEYSLDEVNQRTLRERS